MGVLVDIVDMGLILVVNNLNKLFSLNFIKYIKFIYVIGILYRNINYIFSFCIGCYYFYIKLI